MAKIKSKIQKWQSSHTMTRIISPWPTWSAIWKTVPPLLKSGCVTRIPSSFWAYGRRCTIRILIPPNSRELKTRPGWTVSSFPSNNGWKRPTPKVSSPSRTLWRDLRTQGYRVRVRHVGIPSIQAVPAERVPAVERGGAGPAGSQDSICFTHYFGADYADRIFLFRLIDSPQVTQFCMDGTRWLSTVNIHADEGSPWWILFCNPFVIRVTVL